MKEQRAGGRAKPAAQEVYSDELRRRAHLLGALAFRLCGWCIWGSGVATEGSQLGL